MPLNSPRIKTNSHGKIEIRKHPCESVAGFLELPAVLLRPALHDNFFVCIELNGIAALAMKIAEEAIFPSAEWKIGHGGGDSDVDTNIPCRCFITKPPRGGAAGSE